MELGPGRRLNCSWTSSSRHVGSKRAPCPGGRRGQRHTAVQQDGNTLRGADSLSLLHMERITVEQHPRTVLASAQPLESTRPGRQWVTTMTSRDP